MTERHVVWEMDLDADTPREAAKHALEIQRDPQSIATVFIVDGESIDLSEPEDEDLGDYSLSVEWKGGYHGLEGDIGPRIKVARMGLTSPGAWPTFEVGVDGIMSITRTRVGIEVSDGKETTIYPWHRITQVTYTMGNK